MQNITSSIVITGASSGIGRALAAEFAAPGVTLALIGRDAERLRTVAELCREKGAVVDVGQVDVSDGSLLQQWIGDFDRRYPIDLLVANAGMTAASSGADLLEPRALTQALIETNFVGVVNAVYAVTPGMRRRGRGRIALVSSLAAWRGMALTPIYSATKAAVKGYGEALHDLLSPAGIRVTVICPGFVETEMSRSFPGPRPLMITADQAAVTIRRGLQRGATLIAFPWPLALGMRLLGVLPMNIGRFFLRLCALQPKQP